MAFVSQQNPPHPPAEHGGFYAYEKTIPFNIVTAGVYHAFGQRAGGDLTAGLLSGFTFGPGRIVDANIASEANSGGKLRIVTSAAHGLVNGDIVTTANMNNAGHNHATRVTRVDATTIDCADIAYVAGAGASAGVVYEPAYLQASTGSAGVYHAAMVIDGASAGANKSWKWELNIGITAQDNIVSQRTTTATMASMSSSGHVTLAVGDRVWLSGENITDTTDYTVRHMNLHLHRIG